MASLAMHDRSSLLNMLSMLSGKVSSCYARGVYPRRSAYRCGIEIDIAYTYNYSIKLHTIKLANHVCTQGFTLALLPHNKIKLASQQTILH